jgi:hypothetical protein
MENKTLQVQVVNRSFKDKNGNDRVYQALELEIDVYESGEIVKKKITLKPTTDFEKYQLKSYLKADK